jgi:YaaC-like Protein
MWATLFYLGSVVRYRPHTFEEMIASPFGPFITEFISAQPEQMLYMLASEMCAREIHSPPSHREASVSNPTISGRALQAWPSAQ